MDTLPDRFSQPAPFCPRYALASPIRISTDRLPPSLPRISCSRKRASTAGRQPFHPPRCTDFFHFSYHARSTTLYGIRFVSMFDGMRCWCSLILAEVYMAQLNRFSELGATDTADTGNWENASDEAEIVHPEQTMQGYGVIEEYRHIDNMNYRQRGGNCRNLSGVANFCVPILRSFQEEDSQRFGNIFIHGIQNLYVSLRLINYLRYKRII